MNSYVYHMDEGVLSLPPGFRDATVHAFEWVGSEGRIALAVQRERRPPERTFEEMVRLVTAPYPKKFAAYAEEEPVPIALELPAIGKRFRWRHEAGVAYHHQVFIDLDETLLLLTASGQASSRERVDATLHEALGGLLLRERGA